MTFPAAQRPGPPRFRIFRSISALILREMSTSYGRSPGGYLWVILEPVAGVTLLTVLFSLLARNPPLGTNFPLFYATGMLPFTMYAAVCGLVATAVLFSRAFLSYPAVSFMDALIARFLLTSLTHILVMVLIISGIVLTYDLKLVIQWQYAFQSIGLLLMLTFGIGMANCYLFMKFPVWQSFWGILNRPLFLLSGVFFIPELLPEKALVYILWNPLIHIIGLMRKAFYPTYDAPYIDMTYVAVLSVCIGALGLWFVYRYHKDLALL